MSETVLTYTYTGTLRIIVDNDSSPDKKLRGDSHSKLTLVQDGYPEGAEAENLVMTLREKELDFTNDPLGYFLYLNYAGTPAHIDTMRKQLTLLQRLHNVKHQTSPLPRWKRWIADRLGLIPAH